MCGRAGGAFERGAARVAGLAFGVHRLLITVVMAGARLALAGRERHRSLPAGARLLHLVDLSRAAATPLARHADAGAIGEVGPLGRPGARHRARMGRAGLERLKPRFLEPRVGPTSATKDGPASLMGVI